MLLSITLLCFFFIICQSYLDNRCHSSWYFSLFFRRYYCHFSGSIYFILFTVKIWYKYKSTRSVWPNIANVFRLMNCNKCSEIYNYSVSTLYNLRGHKSFCVVYTEVVVKYQSTVILNICFVSNLNSKHFKFNL